MTDTGHFASPLPTPATPVRAPGSARRTVGVVLAILGTVVGTPASAVLAFLGLITWSDCFIGCSGQPDHATGGLLYLAALLALVSGPVFAATLIRTWSAFGTALLGVLGMVAAGAAWLGLAFH